MLAVSPNPLRCAANLLSPGECTMACSGNRVTLIGNHGQCSRGVYTYRRAPGA